MWDFDFWSKRHSEPEQRIHKELTEKARLRVSRAFSFFEKDDARYVLEHYVDRMGETLKYRGTQRDSTEDLQMQILETEDMEQAFDLIELSINKAFRARTKVGRTSNYTYNKSQLYEMVIQIHNALKEEGILLHLQPTAEEIVSDDWNVRTDYERILLQEMGDEAVIESDQETRMFAREVGWENELQGYNEAWEMYKDNGGTYLIAEKLYNSLEAVTQRICAEENSWASDTDTVGTYLSEIQDRGLLDPNPTMVGEWQQIVGGIKVGVQKLGGDRKRHELIDDDYAILLLHQTGAFLTFLIKKYEASKS
ncbi:hypothetical protein [Halobellus captivus]|uniref:hypothetical protein n=1 Tax=Halobellus captivus TaxID=2592614 RepID=UPI0011A019B6|nr:hypothetical protein [Halobellus captivus]